MESGYLTCLTFGVQLVLSGVKDSSLFIGVSDSEKYQLVFAGLIYRLSSNSLSHFYIDQYN